VSHRCTIFVLQFSPEEFLGLARGYLKRTTRNKLPNPEADKIAFDAGARIRDGDRSKDTLKIIIHWKNSDSRFWNKIERDFELNLPSEVEAALDYAVQTDSGRVAVAALTGLSGVAVRTASAIMAAIYPDRYTVLDQMALRALGIDNSEIAFYLL
jgi:hypothetical protein